jgi:hypothetical protein
MFLDNLHQVRSKSNNLKIFESKNIKESLNLNGQQFHHINKTAVSDLNSLNIKNTKTYGIGNPDPGLETAQTYGEVKLVNVYTSIFIHCSYFYI